MRHIPMMSNIPSWRRSRRYELIEPLNAGICKYLTLHEFDEYNAVEREGKEKWRNEVIEIVTERDRQLWEPYHAPKEPPETLTLYHDDIQFNVKIVGKEHAPVIAFSNPLGLDLTVWDSVVTTLRPNYRLLRYDQRGHGRTSQPTRPVTCSQLADDLATILDHLQIPNLHALVGVSFGGLVTLEFGLRYPQRVKMIFPCDLLASSTPHTEAQREARLALIKAKGFEYLADKSIARWFTVGWRNDPANATTLQAVKDLIIKMSPHGYVMNAHALRDYNYLDPVKNLKVPCVMVCGEQDFAVTSMTELEKASPNGNLIIIRNCGHLPMIEQPEQFSEILQSFL